MDQFIEIQKNAQTTARSMMKYQQLTQYEIIRPFRSVIKNPFNTSSIPETLALSLKIPIIKEELDTPIYTKDIDKDKNLDENIKDICCEIRKQNMKKFLIWWMRSGLQNVGMKADALRKIQSEFKTLTDFGYTEEMLKNQNMEQILSVKNIHANEIPQKQLIDCNISSVNIYKRTEPVGSIIRQKMDAVYIPNDTVSLLNRDRLLGVSLKTNTKSYLQRWML